MSLIKKLRILLSKRDKTILITFLFITIVVSFLELANIVLTMFFITSITDFTKITTNKYYLYISQHVATALTPSSFILIFGTFLILFYIFRCAITFYYTYHINKFAQTRYHVFAFRFFQNYLNFNYKQFTSKNSATIYKLIFTDAANLTSAISSILILLSEAFTVILIYASLVFVNWKMTLVLTFMLLIKVLSLLHLFSKKLKTEGYKVSMVQKELWKIFRESFGNFKIIKLLSNENHFINRFNSANYQLARSNTINATLQSIPKLFLETIGFILLVSSVMYVIYKVDTPQYIIPILSMYALAFYRLMPSITRMMTSYNQMIFTKSAIEKSNPLFYSNEILGNETITFKEKINLKNLSFKYKPESVILSNINLHINKKESIAFIGESGSGKSTIIDIIMGLHPPQEGAAYIDNQLLSANNLRSWRKKIGYIPQSIYLFDGTVAENVVFGRPYNKQKIISVLKQANIYNFLQTQDKLQTKVGEEGILLSGGQKQRIAIARALYSNPEILILDEATSALDNKTEKIIMNEIYENNKDKTLIIVAHRLSTVLQCTKIYKVENKKITLMDHHKLHAEYAKQTSSTNTSPEQTQRAL